VVSSRGRQIARGVKRKMSNYRIRPSNCRHLAYHPTVRILK
jgi:hypothetical protein